MRIDIIKILMKNSHMNMNELASELNITNGALTSHIKKLEDCGIVNITIESEGHGNQKICSVCLDKILIDLEPPEKPQNLPTLKLDITQTMRYIPPVAWLRQRP